MIKHCAVAVAALALTFGAHAQQWTGSTTEAGTIYRSGNVGIGMSAPTTPLEIAGSQTNSSAKFGSFEIQGFTLNNAWMGENVYYNNGFRSRLAGAGSLLYFYDGGFAVRTFPATNTAAGQLVNPIQRFIVMPDGTIGLGGAQSDATTTGSHVLINSSGRVGFGIAPHATARLHVEGGAVFTGPVTGNTIQAHYQDVAEWVPATTDLEPATVVILNGETSNEVMQSATAYDTRVAGVVSAQPGLILGESGASKEMIATTGRVKVKVDATSAPIKIGDLLVTSSRPGYAMRSEPIDLQGRKFHQPGTIIGKALAPLAEGTGEILVLLSMQ